MHTKNINRRLQLKMFLTFERKRMKHLQKCSCLISPPQQTSSASHNGQRLLSSSQPSHSEFSSDTYCSLRRTVGSHVPSQPMTPDLQRGSFQRKFRSLWFGGSSKKKDNQELLESSDRLKSLSSPSLAAPLLQKSSNLLPAATSALTIDALSTDVCPADCQCNQVCPCCIEDQEQEMQYLQRNFAPAAHSSGSRATSQTLPKNFTVCIPASECNSSPPHTSVEDQYVFVVSDLETSHPQLTVRTEQQPAAQMSTPSPSEADVVRRGNERNKRSEDPDRSLASVIPDRMGSAESQDYMYKSSSASESGRGTLPSETERLLKMQEVGQKEEPQYTTVNKKGARADCGKEGDYHRSKYPQLYVAATRAPMPAVIESESWVSDCSTFREVVRPSRESQQQAPLAKFKKSDKSSSQVKSLPMKGKASKSASHPRTDIRAEKACLMDRWKSLESVSSSAVDRDDITSEFTADVSTYNQRDTGLTQDLRTLQLMYDKVFKRLSLANHSGFKSRRKCMGSISTINSVSRAADCRRTTSARKQPLTDSSKKIRKIEEHVVTLAKSVGNLTTELRETEKLHDQVAGLRKEFACLQQQMNHLQLRLDSQTPKSKTESSEKLYSSVKKPSKISRLFTEDQTPLRLFLKRLGYERYNCLFDEERIGMEELLMMTEEKLQKLGIPMGPRTRIIQEIHKTRIINRNRHHH